ncbi:hypothetical protein Tco_1580415, partial [Tanacetum coccineum]
SKKQKIDENEDVEEDNEAKLKMHMVIVKDDDIAVDAIPLATKPPVIGIDREDLETLGNWLKQNMVIQGLKMNMKECCGVI